MTGYSQCFSGRRCEFGPLFYRHVVQRPMTPGLQWFVRFYGRIKPGRDPVLSNGLLVESAASVSGFGMGLESLEIRTSPPHSESELIKFLTEVDDAAASLRCANRSTIGASRWAWSFISPKTAEAGRRAGCRRAAGAGATRTPRRSIPSYWLTATVHRLT